MICGKNDYYSLCLKTNEYVSPIVDFKVCFISLDNIPICVLMVKLGNKIYKCLIGFTFEKEYLYFKNLMNLKHFNLCIMDDSNIKKIITIYNNKHKNFISSLNKVKEIAKNIKCDDFISAKQKLLNMYSDEELWNLDIFK